MPKNFPEVWENRVRQNLESGDTAPWLDGVAELPGDVTSMGEENLIHIPITMFNPDVLINNSAYPLAVQEYTDDEVILKLDKYQTKATKLTDDQIVGASYSMIDAITKSHINAILTTKYRKAIHVIAPRNNTDDTPIFTVPNTDTRLKYEHLVAFKQKCDEAEWPEQGRRLVLSTTHYNDLLLDRERFGNVIANYTQGKVVPVIAGFQIYSYVGNPVYNDVTKRAYGEVVEADDKESSVAFVTENITKKTGLTKQYFSEAKSDPENQSNLVNYRHYFIATPVQNKFVGAILK